MKRAFLLPVLAASLLAGCVYGDYAYRGGHGAGDYYYGRPYVDYSYYGGYGGYGGYRYGGYYGGYYPNGYYRYGYPYAYPRYGYGYPYGYYPYRPYYPYRHHHSRPDDGVMHPDPNPGSSYRSGRAPWRDLGRIPGQPTAPSLETQRTIQSPMVTPPRSASEPRRDGSPTGQMIRRASSPSAAPRRRSESAERQQP
jgi:hypothetical protein